MTELFFVFQGNGSSEEHVLYVWDHFVSKAAAKNVFIIAHSYGGLSFVEMVSVFCLILLSTNIRWNTRTRKTLIAINLQIEIKISKITSHEKFMHPHKNYYV